MKYIEQPIFTKHKMYLCGHDPLPLRDEIALGASAVPEPAVALVALQPRDHPVVAAAGALGSTGALVTAVVALESGFVCR